MTPEERKLYQLHAYRYLPKRVEEARRIIKQGFERMKNPMISMSFGKDSVVMTHLILNVNPATPVVYERCKDFNEWTDTQRVKDEFLTRFPCEYHEIEGPSLIDTFREAGFYIQDEAESDRAGQAQKRYSRLKKETLNQFARGNGHDGSFIGMRLDESVKRKALFLKQGPLYFAKARGLWACNPLAYWKAADTWAYIVTNNLPYDELYDKNPIGRENARNGAMCGTRGATFFGRMTQLKQMYPSIFNEFAAEFPEVRHYI